MITKKGRIIKKIEIKNNFKVEGKENQNNSKVNRILD